MKRPTPGDAVFFEERARHRGSGRRRSLARARALAGHLGIDPSGLAAAGPPLITVVGSKGKGTAATYASASLCAAGLRVGTLTSPGYRSNRERIRVNGTAIGEIAFMRLAEHLAAVLRRHGDAMPADGYLSPTGLFTLMGVRHFLDERCDVMVLEAGMGGSSDEVSLFTPHVVVVTSIFAEHLGILGDSVRAIAADKVGVIGDDTRAVVSADQPEPDVAALIGDAAGGRLRPAGTTGGAPAGVRWPAGLSAGNARLGVAAAGALVESMGLTGAPESMHRAALDSVHLPARLSTHRRGDRVWVVDSAINGAGAITARRWFEREFGPPDSVVICIPDGKDAAGVMTALDGLNVIPVQIESEHLAFACQTDLRDFHTIDVDSLGTRILALGTISFAGEVLDLLDVPTEHAFTVADMLHSH